MLLLSSADFFQNQLFQKILSEIPILLGIPSENLTVWIQIRPNILSGLIWVQTVCKDLQQMKKVAASKGRVNDNLDMTEKLLKVVLNSDTLTKKHHI